MKIGVLVKYHPCSAYARGSVCPFFKKGSRRCSKPIDQCDMPEYNKWLKEVLAGHAQYFHSRRNIYLLQVSGVPLLVYDSLKNKIIGEAAIKKATKENNIYYYWFDGFLIYVNPVDPRKIRCGNLKRLTPRPRWSFRYLTERTLKEIRFQAGLDPKEEHKLNRKLEEIKEAIKTLPIPKH
ncbi:MAG: hypothetical protein QXV37_03005, partial [Candidatus Jordarchaeaceae archaeon]